MAPLSPLPPLMGYVLRWKPLWLRRSGKVARVRLGLGREREARGGLGKWRVRGGEEGRRVVSIYHSRANIHASNKSILRSLPRAQ